MNTNLNQCYFDSLPNEIWDNILWKIGTQGRLAFRYVQPACILRTNIFINTIYGIFEASVFKGIKQPENYFSIEKLISTHIETSSYQLRNIRDSIEFAKFFAATAEKLSSASRFGYLEGQIYNDMAIDLAIEGGMKGESEAIVWLEENLKAEKFHTFDKLNLAKVHLGLSNIYSKSKVHQDVALTHESKAWKYCQSGVRNGYVKTLLHFYDREIGTISKQTVNAFFDGFLDQQIALAQNKDEIRVFKWILSIFRDTVLPAYYEKNREKALLTVLQHANFQEAWLLGRTEGKEYDGMRNVITKKLQAKLEIPETVKFTFLACSLHHDQFMIFLDKAGDNYQENLKKTGLFHPLYAIYNYRLANCLVIKENTWGSLKEFLTADLNS